MTPTKACAALALFLASHLLPLAAAGSDATIAARISRVESGLLPLVSLADRMKFYKIPGMSIAVINNGEIEWARGYGVREAGKNEPVATETLFLAGSISKPVAAMAALRLVEQGRLDLDADVNLKLRSWKIPENEFTKVKPATLRGLLSHGAGLTVHGFPGYAAGAALPTLRQVLDGERPANTRPIRVDVTPGSRWRYSGGGYTVVQQLLIDVSGKAFPDQMRELVLAPIGMHHSTFEQPLPGNRHSAAATAHRNGVAIKGRWHVYPEMAAAGLWTTPSDLARFAIEVQKQLAGKSTQVLSQAMAVEMLKPQTGGWGLGFGRGGQADSARYNHAGIDEGFDALLTAYNKTGQGVVVMTNGNSGNQLTQEVMRAVAREYGWKD